MNGKRILSILIAVCTALSFLAGCTASPAPESENNVSESQSVPLPSPSDAGSENLDFPPESSDNEAASADDFAVGDVDDSQNEELYRKSLSLLFQREFDEAQKGFLSLGSYSDSAYWADFADRYPSMEPAFQEPLIDEAYIIRSYEHGKLYSLTDYGVKYGKVHQYRGLFYLPDVIDDDTAFVQYHAGGIGVDYIWYNGLYDYYNHFTPNAVIVYTNESSATYMHERNAFQWEILSQIAYECGTVVRNVSVLGSSQGCYTAMQFAYDFYADYGIPVRRCLTLDTGCNWEMDMLSLDEAQCAALSEAGTQLYLFEDYQFNTELTEEAVQILLHSDVDLHVYISRCNTHNNITRYAYVLGLFSFAAGEDIEIPDCEFYPVPLSPDMTDVGDMHWSPFPEGDERYIYG